jgi:hypothetical protein
MRLAWFAPADPSPPDDTTLLIHALRPRHRVDVFDARGAHDFVWQHARQPYDLCVYELDDTPAHQFVWPYLVHYPGVTRLRRLTLQTSRGRALEREGRLDDFAAEFAVAHTGATPPMLRASQLIAPGCWPMLAVPLLASRITVVAHAANAEALAADYPGARVRAVTPGVEPCREATPTEETPQIVIALDWPVNGAPLNDALAGFAAGRPVVVFDCPETTDWPSIDPQDWQPRSPAPPICVAIDPRDADHSRRLALRRLRADASLVARLGAAAQEWWRAHATVQRAAAAFEEVLLEAARCEPPRKPTGWPAHLTEDGLSRTRRLLERFGVENPF